MSIYQKQIVRFLIENCICKYYVSAYIKNKKNNDEYMHDINGLTTLIRVDCKPFEPTTMFQYYWLYNINDATKLISFLHNELHLEAHEVIVHEKIKMFLDIDMKLVGSDIKIINEYYDAEDDISIIFKQGKKKFQDDNFARELAYLYFEAIMISLGVHGCKQDFDMSFSTRNRRIDEDTFKISIHIFTNIIATYNECKIIAAEVRSILNSHEKHDLDFPIDLKDKIIDAVDLAPYHKHGSLSINGGSKYENGTRYITSLKQPFKNPCDMVNKIILLTYANSTALAPNLSSYNAPKEQSYSNTTDISQDFYKKVIANLHLIPHFNYDDWALDNCRVKGAIMRPTRFRPSQCSACDRQHDADNTLIIIMNETIGKAYWKCAHATKITKGQVFYEEEYYERTHTYDNSDLDRFISRQQNSKPIKATDNESDDDAQCAIINDVDLESDDDHDDTQSAIKRIDGDSDNESICDFGETINVDYYEDHDNHDNQDNEYSQPQIIKPMKVNINENAEAAADDSNDESDEESNCESVDDSNDESDEESNCESADESNDESDEESICENAEAVVDDDFNEDFDEESICENAEATQQKSNGISIIADSNDSDNDADIGITDDADIDDDLPDIDTRQCRSACYMTVSNGDLVSKTRTVSII